MRRDLVEVSSRHVAALQRIDARLAALESRVSAPIADDAARSALAAMAEDVALLRDSLRLELAAVQDELLHLHEQVADVAGSSEGLDPTAPLTDAEEPRHVVLSADPDPGVRFSALVRLGRRRTDRSVQASLARLDDSADRVVWAALHNLGAFREPSTAPAVARLLGHDASVLRMAAFQALRAMGAPDEIEFDPVATPESSASGAAALRTWAESFAED